MSLLSKTAGNDTTTLSHCEERSDEAIPNLAEREIASQKRLAMTRLELVPIVVTSHAYTHSERN